MNAKFHALKRRLPILFLIAWVLAQSLFSWSAFQAPRYLVDLDFSVLSADLPKADQVAILVPIRQAFLSEDPQGTLMIPRDDAAIQIRIATKDPQSFDSAAWTQWTIDQITRAYTPLEAFQRQLTLVTLAKLDAQQSALWAKASALGEEAWTLSLNASSLQAIQNLQRRKEAALLRLETLDTAILSIESPQRDLITITVMDRYPTLILLQGVILGLGLVIALAFFAPLTERKTSISSLITPRWIDLTVFGLVSAFMAFSGVGILKFVALAVGLLVALVKRPVRWIPLLPGMALLVGVNLMLHQATLSLDSLWLFGVERFTVYLLLCAVIYTLYGDPQRRSSNAFKLAVMILINLGITGLLFVPPLISAWKGLSTRLGEYGWMSIVYVSANLMAYLVFIGHLLVEWCWEKLNSRWTVWTRWSAHGMLLMLGYFSQSRAYWIYLLLAGGLWLFRHWASQRASSRRFWTSVLIGVGSVVLLILVLRALPQTETWIATLSNNVTGVSLEGRFWSLVRLVFTDHALLDASTRERIDLLSAAWFQFTASPIVGQGFGAFATQAVYALQRGVFILRSGYAHADLFELAASTGLLGIGIYAGAILPSVKKVRHESWIWIGLVISLATGMVFRMLFDKAIWWILLCLVALLAKEKDHA